MRTRDILRATTLVAAASFCMSGDADAQSTWYVDTDNVGLATGTSWNTAWPDLFTALAAAANGDTVRVAEGTYKPTLAGARASSLTVAEGITVRGGYAGKGEPSPDARNPDVWVTVLSGDLLGNDGPGFSGRADNSYHVVRVVEDLILAGTAVIDGFTIRGGQADLGGVEDDGAGLHGSGVRASLIDCNVTDNLAGDDGGGAWFDNGILTVSDCRFGDNQARADDGSALGGGLWADVDNFTGVDCLFEDNVCGPGGSDASGGGAWIQAASSGTLDDSTARGNTATGSSTASGGGLGLGNVIVENCRVIDNLCDGATSTSGGGGVAAALSFFAQCDFAENVARSTGGGIAFGGGLACSFQSIAVDCTFTGNRAEGPAGRGGGFSGTSGALHALLNCTLQANHADFSAGGVHSTGFGVTIAVRNSILWGNTDPSGSGEAAQLGFDATPPFTEFSDVMGWTGGLPGSFVISADPLFVDADGADNVLGTEDDDMRLSISSPCIDGAGNDAFVGPDFADLDDDGDTIEDVPKDRADSGRVCDDPAVANSFAGSIDLGAYEHFDYTGPWLDIGFALSGTYGDPVLTGVGPVCACTPIAIELTNALENTLSLFCVGFSQLNAPFCGGVIVPDIFSPPGFSIVLPTNGAGEITIPGIWPDDIPAGIDIFIHYVIDDPGGTFGWAMPNALKLTTP